MVSTVTVDEGRYTNIPDGHVQAAMAQGVLDIDPAVLKATTMSC